MAPFWIPCGKLEVFLSNLKLMALALSGF